MIPGSGHNACIPYPDLEIKILYLVSVQGFVKSLFLKYIFNCSGDGGQRDQRLRPEVPKIASKDFDYHYGARLDRNQETLSEKQLINRIVIPQPPKPVHSPQISQPSTSETHMVVGAISIENNQPISMYEMRLTEVCEFVLYDRGKDNMHASWSMGISHSINQSSF